MNDELLKSILEACAKLLLEDKQILCYIADATGFGFGDKFPTPATPNLNWKRGTQIKNVQSHVRLEVIMVVDENGRRIITAVEAGGPYESEIEVEEGIKEIKTSKRITFHSG